MEKIKLLFTNLKSFRWNMWIALCALSLVPAIYQTIRTALAYVNTSASGIDIIGQMEWYDLIDETLKALLIIPLYSILNRVNKEDNKKGKNWGTRIAGFILCAIIGGLIGLICSIIPTIFNIWVNYIIIPILVLVLMILLLYKTSSNN